MSESIHDREILSDYETAKLRAIKELADVYLELFDDARQPIDLDIVADFAVDVLRINDGAIRFGGELDAMIPEILYRRSIEQGATQLHVSKNVGKISREYYPSSSHDIDLAVRLIQIANDLSSSDRTPAYPETDYFLTNSFNKYGKLVEQYDYSEDG